MKYPPIKVSRSKDGKTLHVVGPPYILEALRKMALYVRKVNDAYHARKNRRPHARTRSSG